MSHYDYTISKKIWGEDYFYALIMAAMRGGPGFLASHALMGLAPSRRLVEASLVEAHLDENFTRRRHGPAACGGLQTGEAVLGNIRHEEDAVRTQTK